MILTIPHQTLEIGHIHINPFQSDSKGRSIAPMTYKDTTVDIQDLSILTPPLTVYDYDQQTCRLRLDLKEHKSFLTKIATLQEYLITTFYIHRYTLLGNDYTIEQIRALFQNILSGDILTVFIYPTTNVYRDNNKTSKMSTIKKGDVIRCAIRFHGIVFSNNINTNKFRLRIQHSLPAIWLVRPISSD
jgi:hypothetical protein